ncbi:septum site-determining protein MinC [Candidatus Fukatsuia symbiotica]|uniref:Probable septum site-determining protein MinC n=1 Tax=Candidatus Fukatsuia symbiotica TaxID=1878942 RepID=A0A2U8I751_9GAMM|nr:septum site-determining protein MinC [Candidatus Fukatsuia symbiotica]AWK14909.1 septum site-determining protein MinC [Candidatus Fukatsuia symbiotica]MEA9445258.1 septum site-determining protein MinC [Candidatus Fukatsuia symbiotica]
MSSSPIKLQGSNFTLVVVHLHSSQPGEIRLALQQEVDKTPTFLQNAPVVINVAMLPTETNWVELQQVVASVGLHVVGFSGFRDDEHKTALIKANLPLLSEGKKENSAPNPPEGSLSNKAQIVRTPVRSGQQIYARHRDLIVMSSVSRGAELIADGNIHVYGKMCGRALAGVSGNVECQIFCTQSEAELVSIAGHYWLSDKIPSDYKDKIVRFYLLGNALAIESLN